jgi:DNA-binding NarL/FixJ family response regulator
MTRVAIVEDNREYRETLETFVGHQPDFTLAAAFGSAEAALADARRHRATSGSLQWDLVLMDLELPGVNGIEATRRLRELEPSLPVVVLTVFENPRVILEAISAGASGYLLKKTGARELAAQLRSVLEGGAPLSPAVAATVLEFVRRSGGGDGGGAEPQRLDLTAREADVLRCLARGRTYDQTAADLGVSASTVRTHIRAIYRKLQVHSVAEAVRKAVLAGLC